MKNIKYKLYDDKKALKTLKDVENFKINSLRKEIFLDNSVSFVSGIGSICFSAAAFNLNQLPQQLETTLAVTATLLGSVCIAGLVSINSTEESKKRRKELKELKLKRKEFIEKYKNLDKELNKKR